MTYHVQVEDFIWKQHIDQLKDLSGTKIQPEAGEATEDLLLHPSQAQPAVEPVLAKDYPYSLPQAKDYPKAKSEQTQTLEPVPEATHATDFPEARKPAVKSPVVPPQHYPQRIRKPPKYLIEEA